jgi:cupin fold WbuC family metalloprotein
MKWHPVNQEIFVANSDIVSVNADDINMLKNQVTHSPNKRVRICAHQHSADQLHEMLIVIHQDSYIRPHKHMNKVESFHMIEGMLDVIIFHDDGTIKEILELGQPGSGKNFFYRLSAPYFHTLHIHTEWVVFHETTNGPFVKNETIYAPWSPENDNALLINQFKNDLAKKIGSTCQLTR